MEYTSHAIGNAALTTGIIGTALGAQNGMGGLAGLLGFTPGARQGSDPEDRPVTRYEMSLIQANNAKDNEIVALKAQQYTDNVAAGIQAEMGHQAVWNATQQGLIGCLQGQVAQLQAMTRLTIPNANVAPGWGDVKVIPTPPPTVAEAASSTTGG